MSHWGDWTAFGLLSAVAVTAAVTDCLTLKIPNNLLYPAILVGFILWTLVGWLDPNLTPSQTLSRAMVGFAAGFLPFGLLFAAGAIRGGDTKLMTAFGTLSASWQCVLSAAVYGLILNLVVVVVIMIRLGIVRRTFSRIFTAALLWSAKAKPSLETLETDSPRIPLAVGLGAGAILAGLEILLDIPTPWREFGPPGR